ncbi:MAG: pilus assembly protein [Gammaproteobacteria bacterium]
MNMKSVSRKALTALALATLTGANAYAATSVSVSQSPVFVSTAVEPNIMLGIDDSGSMDFEVLAPTNDGAFWWNSSTQSFVGCDQTDSCTPPPSDTFNFNKAGNFGSGDPWYKYAYLFPFPGVSIRNSGYNGSANGGHGHFFIAPIPAFAWARSPGNDNGYNNAYFDPAVAYTPWINSDGTSYANMSPTAAQDDPYLHTTTTIDLTQPMQDSGHGFMLMKGMTLPIGTVVRSGCSGSWTTLGAAKNITSNNTYDCIQYFPATFWLQATTPSTALALLPAGYGYLLTAVIPGGLGPDNESMFGFEIKPANFASSAQYNAAIQNFANWFSYYRKRHLALRASLSQTFVNLANTRVGMNYMDETPVNGAYVMYDMNQATQKASLFQDFFHDSGSGGTPTWTLLNGIGKQYMKTGAGAPITQACQKNFTIIFTDGYADYGYPSSPSPPANTNVDGGMGSPYADNVSGNLGDVAAYYYTQNLRTDLLPTGEVTPDPGCPATPPSPLDCNTNLHMDTYGVTLVQQGLIWNVNIPSTTDPYANPPTWPVSSAYANRSPTGIDDLWHATVDGHGEMLAAQTPQKIATALQAVLNSIAARTSSATAVAANSTSLNTNTNVYQASFQTGNWTGDLVAYKVDASGNVLFSSPQWDAQTLLDARTAASRVIATWDPSGDKGVPFEWTNISAAQQAELQPSDTLGSDRLNYLRGDKTNEQPSGDDFRPRTHILGDIVDSAPLYIAAPDGPYTADPSYVSFETAQANRAPVVYVGANDGMLHAFNAPTGTGGGQELFAFVPNGVFANLINLTQYPYTHHFYVDGSPTAGDVKFADNTWHTLLVDGLNAGGNSIYALDVTNPASLTSETALALKVQWEFTDSTLGLTYSRPFIAQTNDTSSTNANPNGFLVFFGSGYDNSDGNDYLYALNPETGNLVDKINLCAAVTGACNSSLANGLSSVTAVNGGGGLGVPATTVYAGDLQGNLWKVDISDPNPANWVVSVLFQARDPSNNPQPITTTPLVSLNPNFPRLSGPLVFFGTGQLLGTPDLTNTQIQSFYAVWDNGSVLSPPLNRTSSKMVQQTLTDTTISGVAVRTVSNQPVDYAGGKRGWFMDLGKGVTGYSANEIGERVITDPRLENGRVVFTTYTPSSNVCTAGGEAFLMALNYKNGGSFPQPELDINGDGQLTSADQTSSGQNPVGLGLGAVFATSPTILSASLNTVGAVKLITEAGAGGTTIKKVAERGGGQRTAWRELQ